MVSSITDLGSQSQDSTLSVIIPCYNQAYYLKEALESVHRQTRRPEEIIVVDDGSAENLQAVTSEYPLVRYVRQENQGPAVARNRGIEESQGDYLVFLDADDRLTPAALEVGLRTLQAHPECALAYGKCRHIDSGGLVTDSPPGWPPQKDSYLGMLRVNYIETPAAAIFRRTAISDVGGFEAMAVPSEDYHLYLRLARLRSFCRHEETVVEYRRHGDNLSGNPGRMLKKTLYVLEGHREYAMGELEAAEQGIDWYREFYGRQLIRDALAHMQTPGGRGEALQDLKALVKWGGGWRLFFDVPRWTVKYVAERLAH